MALYVVGRALLSPNDTLAIEDPGYPLAYSTFKATGANVVAIPVDQDGIVPSEHPANPSLGQLQFGSNMINAAPAARGA
jgi:DNA-binding transcriptional MocR family regulator